MSSDSHRNRNPVGYVEAQDAQRRLVELRREGRLCDLLWLLEHPPTITWGASGGLDHLLAREDALRGRGIQVIRSERGGDVTFHEPGQLVGYPIVDLGGSGDRDLLAYLRRLEGGLISYLATLGIRGGRVPGRTGVWLEGDPPRKIAAMGVRVRRWVASHGFALNVENSLEGFRLIVPCGINDAEVTSVAREIAGDPPTWDSLVSGMHGALEAALGRPLRLLVAGEGLSLAAAPSSGS